MHSAPLDEAPAATVLVVTCNHCPYVIAWNPRMKAAAEEYMPRGVRFLADDRDVRVRGGTQLLGEPGAGHAAADHHHTSALSQGHGTSVRPACFPAASRLFPRRNGALSGPPGGV